MAGSLLWRASRIRSNWACMVAASGWSYSERSNALTHPHEAAPDDTTRGGGLS